MLIIILALIPYTLCPIYDFPEGDIFTGNKIYNPYENIDSSNWYKANFHSHTYSWKGLTDGRKNNLSETIERYRNLRYDFIGISNYQNIIENNFPEYIPVYEHGYNIKKNHQLVLGATNVEWLDYFFIQFRSNKQKILNSLKTSQNIIVLTHPNLRNGYSADDVKQLTDYDYLEIINQNYGTATNLWDSALSFGNLVYGIADDDSHNWKENDDMGRSFNLVNCNLKNNDGLINSLKAGKIISINLNTNDNNSAENLNSVYNKIPKLIKVEIKNDSLFISFNKELSKVEFIGQNGILKYTSLNNNLNVYKITNSDTYLRIKAVTQDSSEIYLNPIIKYNGEKPIRHCIINQSKTWLFRTIWIILIIGFFIYKRIKKNKKSIS